MQKIIICEEIFKTICEKLRRLNLKDFVHLHLHTEYSLLDGAIRIKDLVEKAKQYGMKSIAITDHGVMYGAISFYKEAVKNGIKPILGCEVYTAKRTRFDKQAGVDSEQGHLILLAKNNTGYKNLMKLVSAGFIEGFYYRPRIDMDILKEYNEGLIALSACLSGDIPFEILNNNYEGAKKKAVLYNEIFGQDNFFLELQMNGIEEQVYVNQALLKISKETNIPVVATTDAHYLRREDARAHEILLCIQTGKNINDENRMKFANNDFYLKSPEEMNNLFKNIPEAIENSVKIADRCNVEIEFGKIHLPEYKIDSDTKSACNYLKEICIEGLKQRYGETSIDDKYQRLEYELDIIKSMGYVDYFLIVWDFIKYAKEKGIAVGPGRGSAAGSIVSYALGITNIDPIKYGLLFERFLNPERVSMPDIDIDFCYERRQEVIDYVVNKYGKDKVAQIITFGTMAARAVVRDVGRALDIPYNEVDLIAKMIPFQLDMTIDKALEINSELKKRYSEDERIKELIDTGRLLEGMQRHASIHAAGVVISKEPLTEYVPLQKNDNVIFTQFSMNLLEEIGLLKFDFLGLRTLTVIRDSIELINSVSGEKMEIDSISIEDANVFKLISEGKTSGVFQLESSGMMQFMKELKPGSLEDIIAGISLYRPGPMDQIPKYIKNKNSPEEVKYDHPILKSILNVTYGCMVYQEQVMQIVRDLAGYSMGRSDIVRRAMSKKKYDVMEKEREVFVKGAINKGVKREVADKIFDEMMDFASYAFNKSHAAAYALIAYQTAWLKCYYPVEFMAATLNSFMGNSDKVAKYINECKVMGIEVLPPDINESFSKFTVSNNKIRFGLNAVKNVGENAIIHLINDRQENGHFKDFRDFLERIDCSNVNKRCIESLIKCGAFDFSGVYRSKLIAVYEKMLNGISQDKKQRMSGQLSIFEMQNKNVESEKTREQYPDINEYSQKILLSMEKEMLGLYITGHPLSEFEDTIKSCVTLFSSDLSDNSEDNIDEMASNNIRDGLNVTIAGIISGKKTKTTKNNNMMAFLTLEDLYGSMEIIVFPSTYQKYSDFLHLDNIIKIRGKITIKEEEEPKIICEEIMPLKYDMNEQKTTSINRVSEQKAEYNTKRAEKLYIRINKDMEEKMFKSIKAMFKYFSGNIPTYIYNEKEKKIMNMGREYWINMNESLISELNEKFGDENIKVV
mgnify:CR=1 FL=1